MITVSVIIPAYNAARTLPQTLAALSPPPHPPLEIIVVDDGSSDDTAHIAKANGAHVLRHEQNIGAAAAKNRGAQMATGDILFFTDADIVPPRGAVERIAAVFQADELDGIVGLLDENIPHANWASQFKNLWMNFTYARFAGMERIGLFYTSVAAMRRAVFLELGGFDENYRRASIAEDTEFGQRAWGRGARIRLEPELRVVHLKAYTLGNVLGEDYHRARALTLMRLRKRNAPFFTSVPFFYQLAVPTIYLTVIFSLAALVLQNSVLGVIALAGLCIFSALNFSLLQFLAQKRGVWFALRAAFFLPLDVFVVGLGMLRAFLDFPRGIRY
ncbi:MAG: glycosyltransferase family 2 protein [Chloroflexi bacterium]|nr:glycosyltransferase family 2 protein [Chloroflexota bacterium]